MRGAELTQNPANWREHPPEQSQALKGILEADPGFQVVGMASHGRQAVEMTARY